ncbi:MAG: hypothetical protein K2L18_01180, partial [Acetatifactor sp.]|nr:hypothetical protein [Acetatifactor sp.]
MMNVLSGHMHFPIKKRCRDLLFLDAPLHRNFWVCPTPAVRTVNPPEYGKGALDISKAPLLYGSEYN